MAYADINGARLWYEIMGKGEPLLLHHGYTACRENWMPVAERLQDRYQIILMECRGTGDSEDTGDGYNIPQYSEDVIGLMDHLGIGQLTYAGHSMGGGMGYWLGVHHPERLTRLILMAPIPSGGTSGVNHEQIDRNLAARLEGNRDYFMQQQLAGKFRDDVQTDAWFEHRVDQLMRVTETHIRGGAESMHSLNLESAIEQIKVPTLMLAGAVDGLLNANLDDFRRLPEATLQVFSWAGHDVAIHEPDGVAEAIDRFMQHGAFTAATLMNRNG
ncbi:MAG: alpha/beta hydrolase [Pseudomonadales bacterium]|nr:alpha/beta hydrolase [Pseudomonadales bacterium]